MIEEADRDGDGEIGEEEFMIELYAFGKKGAAFGSISG